METFTYLRRLSGVLSRSSPWREASWARDAAESTREARQRALARRAARGTAPAWSEQSDTCDLCARHLMAGERAAVYRCGDELALVCPLCALEPSFAGVRVAAAEQAREPRHERQAA